MDSQNIRIRLKAFDHRVLDQSNRLALGRLTTKRQAQGHPRHLQITRTDPDKLH